MKHTRVVLVAVLIGWCKFAAAQATFTHQVPLKLPKAANNFQPDLSLVYASNGGNGLLGMGWQVHGLPSISRVNLGMGVKYAGADTFAHSQFGVLVRQADGTYRTRVESFMKFVPSSSICGDAPCSWSAIDRSGVTYSFGTNATSTIVKAGTSAIKTWGIARVADLFGNYFDINYNASIAASDRRLAPDYVQYTMGNGLAVFRKVSFAYSSRADTEPGYPLGDAEKNSSRLTAITVASGGSVIHQYVLDYAYGTVSGRSQLTRVREYGPGATVGAATVMDLAFGWQQGSETMSAGADLMNQVGNGIGGLVKVDYSPAPQVAGAIVPLSTKPGVPAKAPRSIVAKLTTFDGRGGQYSTHFNYSDARRLQGTIDVQRDLGFSYIDSVDDQTGRWTRTTYRQDAPYEGEVADVSEFSSTNKLLRKTSHDYDSVSPATGTEFVRQYRTVVKTYDLGTLLYSQTTVRSFDAFGNVVSQQQDADGLPTVTVATTYDNNLVNWILGRVTEVQTLAGAPGAMVLVGDVRNTWNNNNITAKSEWLDRSGDCPNGCWVTTTMAYDPAANGAMTALTEPSVGDGQARTTVTQFDSRFHAYPAKVANALGQQVVRTYNEDGLVLTSTDANGRVTTFAYDQYGRKSSETRPDGGTTSYSYVAFGDPQAQYVETLISVDATRNAWRREYFDGSNFKYLIRSNGDCGATVIVGGKNYRAVDVASQKDAAGRPYMNSQPYCSGSTPVWSTTIFDEAGRPSYTQLPLNQKSIRYTYGPADVAAYGKAFKGEIDANGLETRKYYDAREEVTAVRDPLLGVTRYGYDALRRLKAVTLPDGSAIAYSYDSLNRRVGVTAPVGSQQVSTSFSYDAIGNLVSQVSAGKTIAYYYDQLNRISLKQPQGEAAVAYGYDEPFLKDGVGRLTSVSDASGVTRYSYTPNGQLMGETKVFEGATYSRTIAYDFAGRPTRLVYPDGSVADYVVTDGGHLGAVKLNGKTFATWSGFDAGGKPVRADLGNGVSTDYSYDDMGHLLKLATTKGTTALQDLSFDWYSRPNTGGQTVGSVTDNRASKVTGGFNTDESQKYTYDDLGRLTLAEFSWGTKAYGYDTSGNLTSFGGVTDRTQTSVGNQVNGGTGLSGVTYDAAGNMATKTLDGVAWGYSWSTEGRLTSVTRNGATSAQMTYDSSGGRVKKVFTPTVGATVTTTYFSQIYEKRVFGDASPERHTLHLIANGQVLASVTKAGTIITASNNPTLWQSQWAMGSQYNLHSVSGVAGALRTYGAALANHPTTVRWAGFGTFAAVLVVLLVLLVRALAAGLLARAVAPRLRFATLGVLAVFGAVACGNPTTGTGDRGGIAPLADLVGNTNSGPPASSILYYHRNQINSSSVITDDNGVEVSRAVYLPFGEVWQTHSAGTDVAASKFTGKELDEETGLYYNGARYYDPAVWRFLSADSVIPSLTDAQSFNRYAYVRNNPIAYVDPSGHVFEFVANVYSAASNAVSALGAAVSQASRWAGDRASAARSFLDKSASLAWVFTKAMAHNPTTYISLAMALATMNPAVIAAWFISTAASISAQAMAVTAGVKNQMVVSALGAVAGALGAGATSITQVGKTLAAWAVNQGITRVERYAWGDQASQWLGYLNSLASSQVVNGTLGATKWVITPFGAMDPPVLAANIVAEVGENLGGPIAGDILAIVSTLMTGLGAAGLLLGIASAAATTVGLPFVLGALAFAGAVVVLELTAAAVISEVGTMIDHMNPPSAPRRRRRRRENVRPKALGLRHCCLAV